MYKLNQSVVSLSRKLIELACELLETVGETAPIFLETVRIYATAEGQQGDTVSLPLMVADKLWYHIRASRIRNMVLELSVQLESRLGNNIIQIKRYAFDEAVEALEGCGVSTIFLEGLQEYGKTYGDVGDGFIYLPLPVAECLRTQIWVTGVFLHAPDLWSQLNDGLGGSYHPPVNLSINPGGYLILPWEELRELVVADRADARVRLARLMGLRHPMDVAGSELDPGQ